jgi:hypothetical protein
MGNSADIRLAEHKAPIFPEEKPEFPLYLVNCFWDNHSMLVRGQQFLTAEKAAQALAEDADASLEEMVLLPDFSTRALTSEEETQITSRVATVRAQRN